MKKLALLIMLCLTICTGLLLTACGGDDVPSVSGGCNHQFEESVILEPTCTTLGSKVMTCKLCGVSKDHSTIPTTDHDLYYTDNEPATCTGDGSFPVILPHRFILYELFSVKVHPFPEKTTWILYFYEKKRCIRTM